MKHLIPPWLNTLVLAAAFLGWAVAAHLGSAGVGSANLNTAIALAPLLLAMVLLLGSPKSGLFKALLGCLIFAGVLGLLAYFWRPLKANVPWLYYLQHLGTHLALAFFFGRTLAPGKVPLITNLAQLLEGDHLSAQKRSYTRWVTFAWMVFFCLNALVSTVLFFVGPPAVWSFHANLLTGPLIAMMFLAEYAVRVRWLPANERPSLLESIRAYRQMTRPGQQPAAETQR